MNRCHGVVAFVCVLTVAIPAHAQWQDPSTHHVSLVQVEKDVRLEVLDWGGSGRPVVLLAGLGNTAHVFDDFAEKLKTEHRVIGIEWREHLDQLQAKLSALAKQPDDPMPLISELLETAWPALESDLREFQKADRGRPPRPAAAEADLQTFAAVRKWYARGSRVRLPEAEFRQMLATDAEGRPTMKRRWPPRVPQAILAGRQMFTNVSAPALAIFGIWNDPGNADLTDPQQRANAEAYSAVQKARVSRRVNSFRQIAPAARVVVIERTDHYVFVLHETDVLREMRAYVSGLQ